jgi:hypothetical protein
MSAIWTLLWLLLAAIVGVVGSALWTEYSFQILTVIVFSTLWQPSRYGKEQRADQNNRLWESKPITPKHEPPPPLKKDTWNVGNEELLFFSDFEDFANVVNWWLADPDIYPHGNPWRLQELPKSELSKLWTGEGPTYGRSYAVFHNQVRLGEIEVKPLWEM